MLINFLSHEADTDTDPQGGSSGKVRASDVLDQFGRDVVKMADKLADLLTDNNRLRAQRATLRDEAATLKARVAPEGGRALTAEEASAWESYTALGKPDEVQKALAANGEATAKLAKLERAERLRAAADASGFKSSVLTTLAGDLDIQVKPVKDGAPLVVVVKDGQETALADYAAAEWADFMPALTAHTVVAPDINAGARGNGSTPTISDDERRAAQRRYSATF